MRNEFEFPGFDVHQLDVVMVDDEGMQRDEILRIFDVDDYETLVQEAIYLADWFREHGANDEERDLYDVAVQLVTFYNMAPSIDRRRQGRLTSTRFIGMNRCGNWSKCPAVENRNASLDC
ncbi:MAG: hypothetical protein AAFU85_24170 [Planctomycetota bacterium]